jgi:hypothetical protein
MRAVIYTRVSTKEQSQEGYSLGAQRDACLQSLMAQISRTSFATPVRARAPPIAPTFKGCFVSYDRTDRSTRS